MCGVALTERATYMCGFVCWGGATQMVFFSAYRGVLLLPCSFKLKTCTNKPTLLCNVSGCAVLLQET
eukprot:7318933-Prymnesium_polylepis.1